MPTPEPIDRDHAVTRGEFDDFKDQVLGAITAVQRKLDDAAKDKQWSLPTIALVVAVLGAPLVFTVRNLYQGEETAKTLADHLEFSTSKAAELDQGLAALRAHFDADNSDMRERTRALEAGQVENETQHRWLADVMNLRADLNHQMERARIEDGKIVYPDQSYWPLNGIGGIPREPRQR